MVKKGELIQVDSDRYAMPQAKVGKNMAVGRLTMHRDGYGFVIPETSSLDEKLKARLGGDIFVPPPAIGSAMHGDRSEEHTSELQSRGHLVCRLLLEKKKKNHTN